MKVIVCDDAVGFPALAAAWLSDAPDIELAATTASATELLAAVPGIRPDAVLLDHMLPEGPSSPDLVRRIRDLSPGVRVVLVSSLPAPELAEQASHVGADAWISKMTTPDGLRAVVRGDRA